MKKKFTADLLGAENLSTQEIAARNIHRLRQWIEERNCAGDWSNYIRGGKINRSEMASECGFARSTLSSNGELAGVLEAAEEDLVARGLIARRVHVEKLPDDVRSIVGAAEKRADAAQAARGTLERRVKTLEEQNAALRAANRDLNEKLRRSAFAEQHLADTGRLLPL